MGGSRAFAIGQDTGQGRDSRGMPDHHDDVGVLVGLPQHGQNGLGRGVIELPEMMDFGLGAAAGPQAFGRLTRAGGGGAQCLVNTDAMLVKPAASLLRLGRPPLGELPLVIAVRASIHGLGMANEDEGAVLGCGSHKPILLRRTSNVTPKGELVGKFGP